MADEDRPDETVEERRARRIAEAKAKLAAKQADPRHPDGAAGGEVADKRGPGTVSATADGLIEPGARPAGETPEDVKAMVEGPGGAVESTTEPATPETGVPAAPQGDESIEQKRAR